MTLLRTRLPGRWSILIAAGVAALQAMPLAAQLVDGALERITWDPALARALVRSPTRVPWALQVENAATDRTVAFGAFLPSLSVSSGASLRSQNRFDTTTDRIVSGSADSYNAGVSTSLALFSGGRRFADLDRSRAELLSAQAQRDDQRFQVTFQTKRFFFTALRQGELLDVANSRLSQAVESLDLTRRQAQVGVATRSDTLRARLEMVNARQAVLEAETAARSARFPLSPTASNLSPCPSVTSKYSSSRSKLLPRSERRPPQPVRQQPRIRRPGQGICRRSDCRRATTGPTRRRPLRAVARAGA